MKDSRLLLNQLISQPIQMAGRKPISINLKSASPDGEVRFFKTIKEAAKELEFSERGVGRAYHAGRN